MKVIESFVRPVVTAAPHDSQASVARLMDRHRVGAVVIVENHRPVGIVTDRDLALAVVARGGSSAAQVGTVMTSPVETLTRGEGALAAALAMKENRARRLPVVNDEGELVGIVTLDDLVCLLGRELHHLLDALAPEMQVVEPAPTVVWDEPSDTE